MSFFTSGDRLKVVVLGNDGIMRGTFVDRKSTTALNKYIISQENVFLQRLKKYDLFWYDQPTIMFRENSIHAIPKNETDSFPTPQETSDIIENSAIHLYTLFGKQTNILMILLLVMAGIAAGGACAGAYFGYQNNKEIPAIHAEVNGLQASLYNITGGAAVDNGGIPTVTVPRGTVNPTSAAGLPRI